MDGAGRLASGERPEPVLGRASEQELDQPVVARSGLSAQHILAAFDTLYFEHVAGVDVVAPPEFGRQDDLPLAGNRGNHLLPESRALFSQERPRPMSVEN